MLGIEKSSRCRVSEHSSTRAGPRPGPERRAGSRRRGIPTAPAAHPSPKIACAAGRSEVQPVDEAGVDARCGDAVVVTKKRWSISRGEPALSRPCGWPLPEIHRDLGHTCCDGRTT